MMENRSFDHMLGLLKAENPEIRGLGEGDYSNVDAGGNTLPVGSGAVYQGHFKVDPGHDFGDVIIQMYNDGPRDQPPAMSGFARNYDQRAGAGSGQAVLQCFTPDQVPVISALAREYVVCDQWYSSVPGPTLPNRAFAHFGTSFGRLDMSPDYFRARPSIYQRLKNSGVKSKIYYYAKWSGTLGLTFLLDDQRSYFGLWGDFKDDCLNDRLPAYSFVEPAYSDHDGTLATDQHPDHDVRSGDAFIGEVYDAIRSNPAVWNSTLFLVLWDEHGGLFDHETPPVVQTDGFESQAPPFTFDRLGVRVPAVVVSPYVARGTVDHTVYEHASIPATVAQQFLPHPELIPPFKREQNAHTFLNLLTLDTPRQDRPSFEPVPLSHAPQSRGDAPVSDLLRRQVDEVYGVLARNFPATAATMDPKSVKTESHAKAFIEKGMDVIHRDPSAAGAPATTG
jgi:phospholipase C